MGETETPDQDKLETNRMVDYNRQSCTKPYNKTMVATSAIVLFLCLRVDAFYIHRHTP